MLADSERLYILQKLINFRQGKGTREHDQIPLRAMAPAYFNEYESRADYYDQWLKDTPWEITMECRREPEKRHELLLGNASRMPIRSFATRFMQGKGVLK